MNKCSPWIAIGTVLATALGAHADGFDAARVPADAQWAAHVDVERLRTTALGETILEELRQQDAERKFAEFSIIFGFDPRRDLESVTLFGMDAEETNSAFILQADMDPERLVSLLKANDSYRTIRHQGQTIHAWIDRDKGDTAYTFGSILDGRTVVVSKNQGLVEKTLAATSGTGASLAGAGEDRWMPPRSKSALVAAGASLAGMGSARPKAAVVDNASWLMLSLDEQADRVVGQAILGAEDPAVAEKIAAVARGMIALASLGRADNPELADLADAAAVEMADGSVTLRVSVDAERAVAHLKREMEKKQNR